MLLIRKISEWLHVSIWLFIGYHQGAAVSEVGLESMEVIDYSDLVVFDAFNGSYLSSQDYRGLLLPPDQEPGTLLE